MVFQPQRNTEEHRGTQRNTEEHRGTQRNTEEHRGTQRNTEEHRGTQRYTEIHRDTQRYTELCQPAFCQESGEGAVKCPNSMMDEALIGNRLRSVEKLVDVHPESLGIAQCFTSVCSDMMMYHAKCGDVDRAKEYLAKIRDAGERFGGDGVIEGEFKKAFGFAKKCVLEGEGDAEKRLESLVEVFGDCGYLSDGCDE